MTKGASSYESTQHELALQFLERYGKFIEDLAVSENFDVLARLPEFQSFVADTRSIFEALSSV